MQRTACFPGVEGLDDIVADAECYRLLYGFKISCGCNQYEGDILEARGRPHALQQANARKPGHLDIAATDHGGRPHFHLFPGILPIHRFNHLQFDEAAHQIGKGHARNHIIINDKCSHEMDPSDISFSILMNPGISLSMVCQSSRSAACSRSALVFCSAPPGQM